MGVTSIPQGSPISGGTQTISDGDYHIASAVTGTVFNPGLTCLTIGGLPDAKNNSGANAELWSVLGYQEHVFTVTWLGNGFYKIKLKDSANQCLEVAGGDTARGANVQQWTDNGTPAQQWRIDQRDDGNGYAIRSRCNGWYLDVYDGAVKNGTNIRLWEGNDAHAQRWYFVPWGGGSAAQQEIPTGEYHIVPRTAPDKALNAAGNGVTDETNIQLWPCRDDGRHTFLALDVANGGWERASNVQLYEQNAGDVQKWMVKDCGGGTYNIISKHSGLNLDITGGKSADGTNIQVWEQNATDAQKWKLIPYSRKNASTTPNKPTEEEPVTGSTKTETGVTVSDKTTNSSYLVTQTKKSSGTVTYKAPLGKKKTSVTIPATVKIEGKIYKVTAIEKNAFKGNKKLKTVKIGANVETIGANAFNKCVNLKKVTIPRKVKSIQKGAFANCKNLKTITIKTKKLTKNSVGAKAFKGTHPKATVKSPKGKARPYKKLLRSKGLSKKAKVK